jgi:SAM-dependent methyltransferase
MCRALANRFERVVGLDISAEMVARARDLTPDPRISFEVIDGTSLAGLADGSVDLVFSFTVFQHIPDPTIIERYVREAGRVLATGGIFAFQWNSIRHARLWALRRRIRRLLVGLGRANPYGMEAPEFLGSRVPASRMRRWLAEAGLDVAAISGEGQLFTWAWARRS